MCTYMYLYVAIATAVLRVHSMVPLEQPNADCKRVEKMEEEPDGRSPQNVSSIWTLLGGSAVCLTKHVSHKLP